MGQAAALWENRDRPILHCPKRVVPPQTAADFHRYFGKHQKQLLWFCSSGPRCTTCSCEQIAASHQNTPSWRCNPFCPAQRQSEGRRLPQRFSALLSWACSGHWSWERTCRIRSKRGRSIAHRSQRQMPGSREVPAWSPVSPAGGTTCPGAITVT